MFGKKNLLNYYEVERNGEFPISQKYYEKFGIAPNYMNLSHSIPSKYLSEIITPDYKELYSRSQVGFGVVYPFTYVFEKGDIWIMVQFMVDWESQYHNSQPSSQPELIGYPSVPEDSYAPLSYDETDLSENGIKELFEINHPRLSFKYGECKKIPIYGISYHIYFKKPNEEIDRIRQIYEANLSTPTNKNKIHLICRGPNGFYLTDYQVKIGELNLELNYGKSFLPVYDKMVEKLSGSDAKGLILLHGEPGCGKTTLLRYLAKNLNRKIIFIPPYLVDMISAPEFIPFLLNNKDSILIIEDAERAIMRRDTHEGSQTGVSNILNISDGILGECLNIQIIATFNTERTNIDPALLRKGRLVVEHKFDKLSVEDSNNLLKHLGIDHETKEPMSLTDIYNFNEENFHVKEQRGTIGFKR